MNMMITSRVRALALALCCLGAAACSENTETPSAPVGPDAAQEDASGDATDGGQTDAANEDAAVLDAGPTEDTTADTAADATADIATDAAPDGLADVPTDATADVESDGDVAVEDTQLSDATDVPSDGGTPDATPDADASTNDTAMEDTAPLENLALPGDLLITEFMANPDGIPDGDGEWFEVVSLATETVDLAHCTLHDGGIDSFPLTLAAETLPMEPGERWVFASSGDELVNGGLQADVVYSEFYLSNQSDEIRISCDGALIDEVAYDAAWTVEPGIALSFDSALTQDSATNDNPLHWCGGAEEYAAGNWGSPGAPNAPCPIPDTEVDSCVLTAPDGLAVVEGAPLEVTGLLFDEGDTDQSPAVDVIPLLVAQAGWGPLGSELDAWTWVDAAGAEQWDDTAQPGYDLYTASIEAPELGSYAALFRFSMDGGSTWTLCDLTGSEDGFAIEDSGTFTTAEDPCVDVVCGDPPAGTCIGDVYTTYTGEGVCAAEGVEAACVFDEVAQDCAQTGGSCGAQGCEGGATVPLPGELVISEIMFNPSGVSDGKGEWFEVVNVAEGALNLEGCVLQGDNDTPHTIATGAPWLLGPLEAALFVRNGDETENGGLVGGYAYSGITLGNSGDALSVHCGDTLIDEVAWDDGVTFPDEAGAAMQLDGGSLDAALNDSGENWCLAEIPYGGAGDLGSPGAVNPLCDPCLDVVCDTPPVPSCEEGVVISYAPNGVCDQGVCIYEGVAPLDCALTGELCVDGACITPCAHLCDLVSATCVGGLEVDYGEAGCEEICSGWELGEAGDDATNTTWCRIGYLTQGEDLTPATACAAAAPDGGEICVDPPTTCEQYCDLAAQACQNDQEIVFPEDDCLSTCQTWPEGDPDDLLSDTAWCRLNHLNMVADDVAFHCAAATPDGAEICVDHCANVVCDPAPASSCEGTVATFHPEAVCDEGVCVSEPIIEDCTLTDQLCEGGLCVPPPTLCDQLCELVATTCFEADAVDFGEAGCLATCEAWPEGDPNDQANGTTWCRINQLQSEALTSTEACAMAGSDGGGVCVTTVAGLVINEVDYDQTSIDSAEFVEIYNASNSVAVLDDYTLVTFNGAVGEVHVSVPLGGAGAELAPGAYLVIGVPSVLESLPEDTLAVTVEADFVQNAGNGGDAVGLFHNDGPTVDTLSYGGLIADWTEGDSDAGIDPGDGALARCPNGLDTNANGQDFTLTETPTPGAENVCLADGP